jgi:glucan 1,3-beta-glucosidase
VSGLVRLCVWAGSDFWWAGRDDPLQQQIDVYVGRGVLIESCKGPVWIVGGASEHHVRPTHQPPEMAINLYHPQVIYQYNLVNTKNVYLGLIQTESVRSLVISIDRRD